MVEEVAAQETKTTKAARKSFTEFTSEMTSLKDASVQDLKRIPTGIKEFDRLTCGGLVEGQMILLAGAPGIGKSTLMLQLAGKLSESKNVLYVSGEESSSQIAGRAARLGVKGDNITLLSETNIQNIVGAVEKKKPEVLIIDSIQTVYHPEFSSSSGTIGQVRESAAEILRLTKPKGIIVFILGHVTKEGSLAGPKVLEHMVDSVLYFDTERDNVLRMLRAHKNRFGSTSETALFKMGVKGLEDVEDASAYFSQTSRTKAMTGRAFSVATEGTRPILTEVQALVSPTHYPFPRRISTGIDLNRCQMLLAALEKHVNINLENKDVYLSLAGGSKISDPALDMAICAAVISSAKDIALDGSSIFIGEVGILGQAAPAYMMDRRIEEARRLGMKRIFVPVMRGGAKGKDIFEIEDLYSLSSKIR